MTHKSYDEILREYNKYATTEDMEEDEVLVLHIDNDENSEEIYVSVEDDDVVQKVFEKYLEIVESEEE